MRFLLDAQLPSALARHLGDLGFAALAVREAGLRDSDDGSIVNFAESGKWTIVTKDEDFVERSLRGEPIPPVVWLRIGNCTNRTLFSWLDPRLPDIVHALESGQRLVEVRWIGFYDLSLESQICLSKAMGGS